MPTCERYDLVLHGFRQGMEPEEVHELTGIPPFFLAEFRDIVELEREVSEARDLDAVLLRRMKRYGFSDEHLGALGGRTAREVRALRLQHGVTPVFKAVDTCAAEFAAETPYFYSTYEDENEALPGERERVVILGSGPNRIGQGIEFDYCCVHAALTVRESGYDAVMINCNPETVSTDYDVSDRLYFEPLTFEDVMNVIDNERPKGVVVQFGGQTPLRIAAALADAGVPILGTAPESIALAEDRGQFGRLLEELGVRCPPYGVAHTTAEARQVARTHRLPAPGAPLLRARRTRHADRLLGAKSSTSTSRRPSPPAPSTRCSSTSSLKTPSRWTSTRWPTARTSTWRPSCSTSKRPASTPATRPA